MRYDFDRIIERKNTDSIKWGIYAENVLPLWVADMDFVSADPIIRALQLKSRSRSFRIQSTLATAHCHDSGEAAAALWVDHGSSRM